MLPKSPAPASLPILLLAILVVFTAQIAIPTAADAQASQYIAPGSLAIVQESALERVEEDAERAPWRLGPLRLAPRLSLTNLGYDDNVYSSKEGEESVADFHALIGAGIAAYSKLGQHTYFSTYAAPEYSWWQDRDELRDLTISYGAGVFGTFNRFQLAVQGTSTDREQLLSSEAEVPVQRLQQRIALDTRLEIRTRLALYTRATSARIRYDDSLQEQRPDILLPELESDTDLLEAVIAAILRNGLEIGLGLSDRQTTFLVDPGGRSNQSTSPVLKLAMGGDRLHLDARLLLEETEFDNPDLERFEETTGSFLLDYGFSPKTGVAMYVSRSLVYGVSAAESTIDHSRFGTSLRRKFGRRLHGRLFAETGRSEYLDPGGASLNRNDDLSALGAEVSMDVGQLGALRFSYSETIYDSNLPDFDRSTRRVGLGLDLSRGLLPW